MFEFVWTQLKNSAPYIVLSHKCRNMLINIGEVLKSDTFGIEFINKLLNLSKAAYSKCKEHNASLFVDSGGYTIIKGNINPRNIRKFIECYNEFLYIACNTSNPLLDYIFSLDIPIFLEHSQYNTNKHIEAFNRISIEESKKILDKYPQYYDKYIFVWQFKILDQYRIWNSLYDEYFSDQSRAMLKHYAVGGMVGIRALTNIDFTPFTALAFKCLKLIYDNRKNASDTSIIHMLGINHPNDRFVMAFLQHLFDYLLRQDGASVNIKITYDTVHYQHISIRNRDPMILFVVDDNIIAKKFSSLTESDISHLAGEDVSFHRIIAEEVDYINKYNRKNDSNVQRILVTNSNIEIDHMLDKLIRDENVVDKFLQCRNNFKFQNYLRSLFDSKRSIIQNIELYDTFNIDGLIRTFSHIYAFYDWWINNRSDKKLEKLVHKFIATINCPVTLN